MPIPQFAATIATWVMSNPGTVVAVASSLGKATAQMGKATAQKKLKQRILDCLNQLKEGEEGIIKLKSKLTRTIRELEKMNENLREFDIKIELLEKEYKKLGSFVYKFIAILTFRYGRLKEQNANILKEINQERTKKQKLSDRYDVESINKNQLENEIELASNRNTYLKQDIDELKKELSQS